MKIIAFILSLFSQKVEKTYSAKESVHSSKDALPEMIIEEVLLPDPLDLPYIEQRIIPIVYPPVITETDAK